ncbi:hypothetical protein GCM10023068_43630 [Leifsonia shinshuensis]
MYQDISDVSASGPATASVATGRFVSDVRQNTGPEQIGRLDLLCHGLLSGTALVNSGPPMKSTS